jgi:hypothetical protein
MMIQVTGSREVTSKDRPHLEAGLREVVGGDPGPHTLRHGAAPGADCLFATIARGWGWTVLDRPADWDGPCRDTCRTGHRRPKKHGAGTYCPVAGHDRNQDMVDEGADYAVAAYKRGAKNGGTSDCVKRIRAAGIDVHRVVVP